MTDAETHLPMALVQYVDAKMAAHAGASMKALLDHTEAEMLRFGSIQKALENISTRAEERHAEMLEHWKTHEARTGAIERAFQEDAKGRPDYFGHYGYHGDRKAARAWREDMRAKVVGALLVAGALGFAGWAWLLLWRAAAAGPVP